MSSARIGGTYLWRMVTRCHPEQKVLMACGVLASSDFGVPLARCVRDGVTWACSVPFNASSTRRLTGAPCRRPGLRDVVQLSSSVDTNARLLDVALGRAGAVKRDSYGFMDPMRIVKFIISTRRLRNLQSAKASQADALDAALGDVDMSATILGPIPVVVSRCARGPVSMSS